MIYISKIVEFKVSQLIPNTLSFVHISMEQSCCWNWIL